MNFFHNTPKSHKFYAQALKYLDQHEIKYQKLPNYKMKAIAGIQNVHTKKIYNITLKIELNKLYVTVKDFIKGVNDYSRQVEYFEDFTTMIYYLKFNEENEKL
jgi:hypothetical protein